MSVTRNHDGYKTMIEKFNKHRMKRNLLLLKELLEHGNMKLTSIWVEYQKIIH